MQTGQLPVEPIMDYLQHAVSVVVLSIGLCGCGENATTPDDITAHRPKRVPTQVVLLEAGGEATSPNRNLVRRQVTSSTLVEFHGKARLTEEDVEKERKFNLRIVRYRADGSRITVQQGTASATKATDSSSSEFRHALEIPDRPGNYSVLVTVGKRVVSETPLTIKASEV